MTAPTIPPALLALAIAVSPQAVGSAKVLLEGPDGKIETRDLAGFDTADPRQFGARLVRFEGLKSPPASAAGDELAELTMPSGDRLSGRVHGGRAELVDIEILGGVHLGLALDEIHSVVFPARIPAHGTIVPSAPAEGDRLYRRASEGLDVIDGGVEEFTTSGVRIHGENVGSKLIPWSEIAALFIEGLVAAEPRSDAGTRATPVSLDLRDGGRLRGSLERLSSEGCRIATRNGERLLLPVAAIALLVVEDGTVGFLSSIAPASAPPSLPFGDDLGMRWPPKVDRSVTGGPLVAGGRPFARGFGVHAPSRMTWKLDGAWKHLRGAVAVDDEVLRLPSRGAVVFKVLVDEKPRFESRELHGGDPPVSIPAIDLPETGELELVVEAADGTIVADRADWLEMVLWR